MEKLEDQYLSTLFVLSQNKKLRLVFNLKSLNNCVQLEKFKLEDLDIVRILLRPEDYLMKLDLKDVYFTVPIYEPHKKYPRFQFQNITHEFQCLPFGPSTGPRVFTQLNNWSSWGPNRIPKRGNESGSPSTFASIPVNNFPSFQSGRHSSTVENPSVGSLVDFRTLRQASGLPEEVCQVLIASWRGSTQKRYEGP